MKLESKRGLAFHAFILLLTVAFLSTSAEAADKKKKKKKDKGKESTQVEATQEEASSVLAAPPKAAREADRHLIAYDTEAANEALEASSEPGEDAWVVTARGRVLEQRGDYDAAKKQFQRASELDEKNPAPMLFLGDTHAYASERSSANEAYAKAEARARGLVDSKSDDPEALYYLGLAQQRQKRFAEAAGTLEKARELRPKDSAILYQLGATRFYQEQFQSAFDLLSEALEQNSGIAYAYYYRGLAAAKLGRKDLTYNDLDRFVKMAPAAPEADTARQLLASFG